MLGFWLKKAVSAMLLPIPLATLLVLAGVWLFGRRPRLGQALILAGPLLLLFLSSSFGSQWLSRPLEGRYPVWNGPSVERVMVLGSGHDSGVSELPLQQLSDTALARLTEGVRIHRLNPGSVLVLSGWRGTDVASHAEVAAAAAQAMGVAPEAIVTFSSARDTAMEARLYAEHFGPGPLALVTSADHLPRAMALFRSQGVDALPAPTDFQGRDGAGWRFSAGNLQTSERALHEYLGRLWRLLVSPPSPAEVDATGMSGEPGAVLH